MLPVAASLFEPLRRYRRSPPPTPGLMPSPLPCASPQVLNLLSRLLGTVNQARRGAGGLLPRLLLTRPPQASPGDGVTTFGLLASRGTRGYPPRIPGPPPASSPIDLHRQTATSVATPAGHHRGELPPPSAVRSGSGGSDRTL